MQMINHLFWMTLWVMWNEQSLKYVESLQAIILVFSEFCIPIFAEELFVPTESHSCQGLDVSSNFDIFSFNAV